MGIKDIGYLDYFGEKCVYIQEDMSYTLVPVNEGANIQQHFMDEDYLLPFSSGPNKQCIASVKKQTRCGFNSICLELNYVYKGIDDSSFDGFSMVGNEIDEFFSPLEYYFHKKRSGNYQSTDLLYGQEVAARFQFICDGQPIQIELIYGNVLTDGIRTDLTLHPQLIVRFSTTKDTNFVFHVASTIIRFLQFVHRKTSYNIKAIELFHNTESGISYTGYMFASMFNIDTRPNSRIDASFIYYGKKIENILSLIATEKTFALNHLNFAAKNEYDYTAERLAAISAAFEYEYSKNQEYAKTSDFSDAEIKKTIVDYIDQIPVVDSESDQFRELAKSRISSLGTQPGLKTKIMNAYNFNASALESSLPSLLVRQKKVEKAAACFVELRGKVLHHDTGYVFNDVETESIRFIDVLQFVMVLKRAKYTDQEVELLLGPLYSCNTVYVTQLLSNTKKLR